MICVIYLITGLHPLGQSFWRQPLVSLLPGDYGVHAAQWVDSALGLKSSLQLHTLPINVAFLSFGALGTVGNIVNR
jgi:ethanolaminephosphotransferase